MASIAAFVYFWSSAYEVSGGCATDTLNPFFFRMLATGSHPEPSAKAPCTRTTFLIGIIVLLFCCSGLFASTRRFFGIVASIFVARAPTRWQTDHSSDQRVTLERTDYF